MNKAVQAAYDRVYEAEKERAAIIEQTYALGDIVAYTHGQNEVSVEIIGHSQDRLLVRGLNSGREYWIGAYRVV
jgi:hypothetical protein